MHLSSKQLRNTSFKVLLAVLMPFSFALAGKNYDAVCMDRNDVLQVNNSQLLTWRNSSRNGFQARGHAAGVVDEIFPDRNGHKHFSLKIGPRQEDHVEIIYNLNFGYMPDPNLGDKVEACGDYITSNAPNNGYQASPDGAIIHWVHASNNKKHESGFVIINNVFYGNH